MLTTSSSTHRSGIISPAKASAHRVSSARRSMEASGRATTAVVVNQMCLVDLDERVRYEKHIMKETWQSNYVFTNMTTEENGGCGGVGRVMIMRDRKEKGEKGGRELEE
uniref:Uncharacterized protein n=1 Tax=Guillardia theta TaxID=55529 RepID=A0A7S4HBX4_GUITH|mmetsp:Transcript_13620/g.47306  ORF Transcript_13620/g.47306 Transcript_13620/m.47306 type:complete len:109 (+) Transcript_13620:394-720(+)